MAAIVRQALVDYLARQPDTPQQAVELATTVAALAARVDGLQDQVETLAARLDMLTARRQPPAAKVRQPRQPRPHHQAEASASWAGRVVPSDSRFLTCSRGIPRA
jgi:hypothetical protein